MRPEVQLVIFDCDGVLVDSEIIQAKSFAEVLGSYGVDLQPEQASHKFAGLSLDGVIQVIESDFNVKLAENFGETYREKMRELFRSELKAVPGIIPVLQKVSKSKCVVSNGPKDKMELTLALTGVDQFFDFDHVFSAYDIGIFKPDPGLYLAAAEIMKVSPKNCLVLEDSRTGAQAAVGAGMQTVFFNRDARFQLVEDLPLTARISKMEEFLGWV